jgi:glutamate 5-kinase
LKQLERNYKRVVVKIGSSLFGGNLDFNIVNGIAEQIIQLIKEGEDVVIVSSGAIALGMSLLKVVSRRPRELSSLQAFASIGQNELMNIYRNIFEKEKLNCAQVLLTWDDFDNRKRYLNAKNTLLKLLELNTVPIINENDTVSTDEIKFGDNDRLSALVATLINADLLIILSDVDGLLDKDKRVIRLVDEITPQIRALACPTDKKTCVGGMITKLEAAKIATDSGIPCVIASGFKNDIILSVIKELGKQGTLFIPKKGLAARERWIAFSAKAKGKIIVDDGAKRALIDKKSLLSVGVVATEGAFEAGDVVSVRDKQNSEFARGKVGISARQLGRVKGRRYEKEVIHRDNIVIL